MTQCLAATSSVFSSAARTLIVAATITTAASLAPGKPANADSAAEAVENISSQGLGDYFGAKPPGDSPELFAPGLVSKPDRFEAKLIFSQDLQECYLTETDATFSQPKLLAAYRKKGAWTAFAPASFSAKFKVCHEPFISRDNQKLYFTADGDSAVPGNERDFWVVERTQSGWGEPTRLPTPINSPSVEFFYNQTSDGTVVFASNRPGGQGHFDLYYVVKDASGAARAVNFGPTINSPGPEFDPCISPDGRFLIFASVRDGANNLNLYISHHKGDNTWSKPVELGGKVNTAANEYGPSLSPDGQYLFFVRHDGKQSDVYWIRTASIVGGN